MDEVDFAREIQGWAKKVLELLNSHEAVGDATDADRPGGYPTDLFRTKALGVELT